MERSRNFFDFFFWHASQVNLRILRLRSFHALGDGVGLTVQAGAEVEGAMLVDGADP